MIWVGRLPMPVWACVFLVALLPRFAQAQDYGWTLHLGQEYDSNPLRVVEDGSQPDTATRLLATGTMRHVWGRRWSNQAALSLGGRILANTTGETAVVSQFRDSLRLQMTTAGSLGVSVDAKDRTEYDGFRDYSRATGTLDTLWMVSWIDLVGSAGWTGFRFKPNRSLDWTGPSLSWGADAYPWEFLTLHARHSWTGRWVSEPQLVVGPSGDIERGPEDRRDSVHAISLRADLSFPWAVIEVGGQMAWNRSNSFSRGFTRQVLDATATANPAGELVVRLAGQIQRTSFQDTVFVDESFALDDENRNQLSMTLEHPFLHPTLSVETRGMLWADAFGGDETEPYLRWTAYLGLVWRGRSRPDGP